MSDRFAFDVAGLRGFLWDHAMGLLRNPSEADDLVQDTIERALSCRHLFRPGSNLRAWTRSIMRNMFIDGWRRRFVYVALETDQIPDPAPAWSEVELGALDLVRMDHVRLAADRLTAREGQIFTLAHIDGLSYRDVATRLRLNIRTVGTQLFRIRQKLHAILEQ